MVFLHKIEAVCRFQSNPLLIPWYQTTHPSLNPHFLPITYPFWHLLRRLDKFVLSLVNGNSSGFFSPPPPPFCGGWEELGTHWWFCLTNIDILNNRKRRCVTEVGSGGYSWEFLVGLCRPILQIMTLFQTKNVISHTRFQIRPIKSIQVFIPGL